MKVDTKALLLVLIICMAGSYIFGGITVQFGLFPVSIFKKGNKVVQEMPISEQYALKGKELLAALQEGGYTIYFRHADRAQIKNDSLLAFDTASSVSKATIKPPNFREGICLSEQGKAESWFIGQVFQETNIPVGQVISSPICRAKETAFFAFNRIDQIIPSLVFGRVVKTQDEWDMIKKNKRKLLSTKPLPGTNNVIIAHRAQFDDVDFKLDLKMSEAAIIKTDDEGIPHYVAKMKVSDWLNLIDRKPFEEL